MTIKLYFENLSIFVLKQAYLHAMNPLPLFVFVRFSTTPHSRPQQTYFLNDPLTNFWNISSLRSLEEKNV